MRREMEGPQWKKKEKKTNRLILDIPQTSVK